MGGTLILTGSNSYAGPTTVTSGTLQTTTASLSGNVSLAAGTTLDFNQSFNGAYGGMISGTGALQINLVGGTGTVKLTGNSSPAFTGNTTINHGGLIIDGSIASSPLVSVLSGAFLGGIGTVGTTMSTGGTITPGDGTTIGTLSISGTLTLDAASTALIGITPTSADVIAVSGTANLGTANLTISPESAFYPPNVCYTILTSAGLGGTTFKAPTSTSSNFVPTLSYTATNVILCVRVLNPFLGFPFGNRNERAVGNNIGALNAAGVLPADLVAVLDLFVGQSNDAINAALDQLHPAPYSAFTEFQEEMGAQIVSLFHRKPHLSCACDNGRRIWVQPFGDSLTEKRHGEEFGFTANSGGLAAGFDGDILCNWIFGFGAAWNNTHLKWHSHHGHGEVNGIYASLYTDYRIWNFYLGGAIYGGVDLYDTERHIDFFSLNEHSKASYTGYEAVAQLNTAYFFGAPTALLYPYANFDLLYLHTPAFHEQGAGSLSLHVAKHSAATFRTEMGLAFQVIDTNMDETMCISPLFSIGWVNMCPIERQDFHSTFDSAPISFETFGWDQTWNLFSLDFGLAFSYRCFTMDLKYNVEMSADKETLLYNQYGNIRFDWKW